MNTLLTLTLLFQANLFYFYNNSLRRAPDQNDLNAQAIVQVLPSHASLSCSGFFLKNKSNRNLILTAFHCFNSSAHDLKNWCSNQNMVVAHDGKKRKCQNIHTYTPASDVVLIEVDGPAPKHALSLGYFPLEPGLRLSMLGYPLDPKAKKGLNITENCWIEKLNATDSRTPHILDRHFTHNCSTYGGNSGGPMILEGTNVAVAFPRSYHPDDFENRSSFFASDLASDFSYFIDSFKDHLKIYQVDLIEEKPSQDDPSSHITLLPGFYISDDLDRATFVMSGFDTTDSLTSVNLVFEDDAQETITFECDKKGCISTNKAETYLLDIKQDRFLYLSPSYTKEFILQ